VDDTLGGILGRVREVVPECAGFSLGWTDHQVTFTLVATDDTIALLDAVQYLEGGPCVDAVGQMQGIATTAPELHDDDPWRLFARATAARGVRSSLTLPIVEGGSHVIGSVNLYATTEQAFDGHHEEIAGVLATWAPDAVRSADLSFSARRLADQAPQSLRAQGALNRALGLLAVHLDIDVAMAHERLDDAAVRAGIAPHQLATSLIALQD
jgi:GAF domain-containing protein